MKTVFITGATAGIGKATASRFAKENHRLIITGRRNDKLMEFAAELRDQFSIEVLPLCFDVRKRGEVEKAIGELPPEWQNIDILVNNAGLAAGLDPIQEADAGDWETMIDTNVKGLLFVSRLVIPLMLRNGSGHIFNIGSIAGREVYAKGSVYCATKHAVDAITKGMRIDLLSHGIKVTQISPGAVETEFSMVRFKGNAERAAKVYQGYQPLEALDVAEIIHFISTLPSRVNVNDILVMPQAQANATTFHKL
jgi:hypothetical protein